MAISIQCPGCKTKLKLNQAPEKAIKLKCPKCEHVIGIKPSPAQPAGDTAPAEAKPNTEPEAPAASPTVRKAAASAAQTRKKPAARKKKKAKAAADDWDDLNDFGDDFEDDFGDEFDDDGDDFDEPVTARRSRGGAGKSGKGRSAKGKASKGKANSGSSTGTKIGIAVVAVLVVGGAGFGAFMYFGDDKDDSGETAQTDPANPEGGGGENAGAGAVADAGAGADASGQNAIDMSYLPADSDLLIHVRVSEIWSSPLVSQFKGQIPPGAFGDLPPDDIDSLTVGVNIGELISGAAQAAAQAGGPGGGFGGGPPGGFPGGPPGQRSGMGPGFPGTPNYIVVARLKKSVSPQAFGATDSVNHNGKTIHKLAGQGAAPALQTPGGEDWVWFVDGQTAVIGKEGNVKKSVDAGGREVRFARFDFIDKSNQLLLALAPSDTSLFTQGGQAPPTGNPVLDRLQTNLTQGTRALSLGLSATTDLRLNLQFACKNPQMATTIQTDATAGIQEGQKQLTAAIQSMGMMGLMLKPVEGIVGRAKAVATGDQVVVSLDANQQEISALSKTVGPLLAGMGGGPGGPPGLSGSPGAPAISSSSGGDNTPFGAKTQDTVDFEEDVAPILKWRCGACHIDDAKGQLSLASYDSLMAHKGKHGKAVVAGDPDASSFFKMTSTGKMPPKSKLRDSEIETIRLWIEAGARPPGTAASVKREAVAPAASTVGKTVPTPPPATVSFKNDVFPVFRQKCGGCHINQRKGNLSLAQLSTFSSHNGKKGPVITAGNPNQSSLYTMIMTGKMPPRGQLSAQQTESIRKWIEEGARDN